MERVGNQYGFCSMAVLHIRIIIIIIISNWLICFHCHYLHVRTIRLRYDTTVAAINHSLARREVSAEISIVMECYHQFLISFCCLFGCWRWGARTVQGRGWGKHGTAMQHPARGIVVSLLWNFLHWVNDSLTVFAFQYSLKLSWMWEGPGVSTLSTIATHNRITGGFKFPSEKENLIAGNFLGNDGRRIVILRRVDGEEDAAA